MIDFSAHQCKVMVKETFLVRETSYPEMTHEVVTVGPSQNSSPLMCDRPLVLVSYTFEEKVWIWVQMQTSVGEEMEEPYKY